MKTASRAHLRYSGVIAIAVSANFFVAGCGANATFVNSDPPKKVMTKTTPGNTSSSGADATGTTTTTTTSVEPVPTASVAPVVVVPKVDIASLPTPTPDPGCPSKTVVTLMSSTFKNNALNQYIQYKLSQTDCNGVSMPISVSEIRFDVNARVVTGQANVPFSAYLVSNPTNPLATGSLQTVTGKDMFGSTQPGRWYYSTTNQVSIPASTYEIYFSLDYSCTIMHRMGTSSPYPSVESIDSYLAFGDVTPVTQALQVSNSQLSGACR